jgi:hypothetical protein
VSEMLSTIKVPVLRRLPIRVRTALEAFQETLEAFLAKAQEVVAEAVGSEGEKNGRESV